MILRKSFLLLILLMLCLTSCAVTGKKEPTAEELLKEDADFLAAEIMAMYDEVRPELLYDPGLFIAFSDLDFDGIPEFFYGYQTITGSHNKIWYRVYSLRGHNIIGTEHTPDWSTYLGDPDCSFFTGPESFLEGYYQNSTAETCFVTTTHAGPVTDQRVDFAFVKYTDSKISVETGVQCGEELQAVKQAWAPAKTNSIKSDMMKLLDEYLNLF